MAARTRIFTRCRSPLLIPPNTLITKSWASLDGSIGPPTSGTHSGTPVVLEDRESQAVLVAVKRPVRLADYYCLEASAGVAQVRQ